MPEEINVKSFFWVAAGTIISALMAINAYFVKGLVDKVEGIARVQSRLDVLEYKVDSVLKGIAYNSKN